MLEKGRVASQLGWMLAEPQVFQSPASSNVSAARGNRWESWVCAYPCLHVWGNGDLYLPFPWTSLKVGSWQAQPGWRDQVRRLQREAPFLLPLGKMGSQWAVWWWGGHLAQEPVRWYPQRTGAERDLLGGHRLGQKPVQVCGSWRRVSTEPQKHPRGTVTFGTKRKKLKTAPPTCTKMPVYFCRPYSPYPRPQRWEQVGKERKQGKF